MLFAVVSVALVCFMQERGALGFERHYHVTDPFIRRLGLEAELQVSGQCLKSKLSCCLYCGKDSVWGRVAFSLLYGIVTDYLVP